MSHNAPSSSVEAHSGNDNHGDDSKRSSSEKGQGDTVLVLVKHVLLLAPLHAALSNPYVKVGVIEQENLPEDIM